MNYTSSIPEENDDDNSFRSIYSSCKPQSNLRDIFRNSFILNSLSEEEVKDISKNYAIEESFKSGSIIYNSGEKMNCFYILKKGTIEFMGKKSKDDEPLLYGPIEPNEVFSISSFLKGHVSSLSAIASSDVTVIKLTKLNEHLLNLLSLRLYEIEKVVDFSKALKEKDDFQREISIDKARLVHVEKNSSIPEFPYSIYVIYSGAVSKISGLPFISLR